MAVSKNSQGWSWGDFRRRHLISNADCSEPPQNLSLLGGRLFQRRLPPPPPT